MKSRYTLLFCLFLLFAGFASAQAPQGFNYQAVARDASGNHLANQAVGIKISLRQGTANGTVVFAETHSATTTNIGLVNLKIGGGTATTGTFNTINWGAGPYFVEIGLDATGGTSYTTLGTQQLMSVPYALYAENGGTPGPAGPAGAAGPAGPQGNPGVDGIDGIDGVDGASFLSGSGAPMAGMGNDGDTYIDLGTGDTYFNTAGTWALTGSNLMGPAGAAGPAGPAGAAGPAGSPGATGPAGPAGPVGATGPAGTAGATGPAGPAGPAGSANMTGTTNYLVKFTGANTGGNSQFRDDGTGTSIGAAPSAFNLLYVEKTQLTAVGDGQSTIYGYRTRDSQNDGTGYDVSSTNVAVKGYSYWGDLYSFGVGGFCYNDYTRTGGVLGTKQDGSYWGSLGYKNSGSTTYGVYGTSGYASGTGFLPSREKQGVGGGFFGDMVGSYSRGQVIGQMNTGELFATYNLGDVYTSGKQVEIVNTGGQRSAAYAVTSPDVNVYKKGTANMVNGSAYVAFDETYRAMLGETPVVTITPMGACNGVYIASIDQNGFTVKELNSGSSSVKISWIAVGDRVDAKGSEMPAALKSNSFDDNLKATMFDDGNKEEQAKAMWWDGSSLQFGNMPSNLIPKGKSGRGE